MKVCPGLSEETWGRDAVREVCIVLSVCDCGGSVCTWWSGHLISSLTTLPLPTVMTYCSAGNAQHSLLSAVDPFVDTHVT